MTSDLRFLFDQHVNGIAMKRLRATGVDVLHVAEADLSRAADPEVMAQAVADGRIVVTRNYRDFAPLVQAYVRQGRPFPGVLFYARSVMHSDVGSHVRALREWIDRAQVAGRNPIEGGMGWLH